MAKHRNSNLVFCQILSILALGLERNEIWLIWTILRKIRYHLPKINLRILNRLYYLWLIFMVTVLIENLIFGTPKRLDFYGKFLQSFFILAIFVKFIGEFSPGNLCRKFTKFFKQFHEKKVINFV